VLATPGQGPDHNVHNGAVVVLDPADGAILAMVGSPDFADARIQGQVNGALALRQPGSAIKPLTYAAALERGWTPATTILDVPSTFTTREGDPYTPQNYDLTFHGPLALREALATSSNVAAVRVLDRIGIPALLDIAGRLGVASLGAEPGRYGLALTLGGGEVSLLELSGAYAAFANGGSRVRPYAVLAVSSPGVLPAQPERTTPARALAPEVAYLISDMLSDRYARMRAFGEASALDVDRPAAAKTGTTSDWRDNWTLGYSPDRVVGIWVGNADGRSMRAVSGISGAGPVWHAVMLAAHRGLPPRPFVRPPGIVEREVCAEGGMLPAPACPATRLERFIEGTAPTQPDTTHRAVWVDPLRDCELPPGTPGAALRLVHLLPPEAEPWALSAGLPRAPRARCGGGTGLAADDGPADEPPRLLTPLSGAIYALSAELPLDQQRVELRGLASGEVVQGRLLIDGIVVATLNEAPLRALWEPAAGAHRAQLEVVDARGRVRRSTVVEFWVEP
jgi:membrane carboxypeptidase/penicillin-binding protein PbpC